MSDIEIEIDGKKCQAKPNAMVIQVADEAGIYIPRFCYHKHLSIAANCRMCLVEVEKSPKPLPACATPVAAGMKVFTKSPKALAAQKAVMEFLLINHPLDCPICDQGGECELQDLSMGFGAADSYYTEGKRSIKDKDLGPLISSDMTRCIYCTRCVRFGSEVAGLPQLGGTGRGEHTEIGTYIQQAIVSEVSGNVIDLCPVGALTSKPFRFTARAWELNQYPTIAAHDCVGSNVYAHTRAGKVMRMVPRENPQLNQTWISDRDRFSYEGLYHADRLTKPLIRRDNQWQEVDWQTALEVAVQRLQHVLNASGVEQLAALASPNSTLEEFFLLQKLLRSLGSDHIDHRLRQVDFSDQQSITTFPGFTGSLLDIEQSEIILLIGSNIQKEQPMIFTRIRKAALKGAKVIALNMLDYAFHFPVAEKYIVAPDEFVAQLATLVDAFSAYAGKKITVLVGALALNHPDAATISALSEKIAIATQASFGLLTEGSNTAGAWLAGAVPHRGGLDAQAIWRDARQAYLLLNVEPDLDCANPVAAKQALEKAECVIALSLFKNPVLEQHADVILPITPFTETAGTFVNMMGEWQSFKGVATPVGESRPAWKVLRVLGNLLHLPGFDYTSAEEVKAEIESVVKSTTVSPPRKREFIQRGNDVVGTGLVRIGEIPLYSGDSLVRRAKSLQTIQPLMEGELAAVRIHPKTAEKLAVREQENVIVKQGSEQIRLPVIFDQRVPLRAAFIAGGLSVTAGLSELFGPIDIQKA